MLWAISIIFLLLWALGLTHPYTIGESYTIGGSVHILVALAAVLLFVQIYQMYQKAQTRYRVRVIS